MVTGNENPVLSELHKTVYATGLKLHFRLLHVNYIYHGEFYNTCNFFGNSQSCKYAQQNSSYIVLLFIEQRCLCLVLTTLSYRLLINEYP